MATGKIHRSMGSSKTADGLQSKVAVRCYPKLVREAEQRVTVSTCWGPGRSWVKAESCPCPSSAFPSGCQGAVEPGTTSPPVCCRASVGGGCHGAVGGGLCCFRIKSRVLPERASGAEIKECTGHSTGTAEAQTCASVRPLCCVDSNIFCHVGIPASAALATPPGSWACGRPLKPPGVLTGHGWFQIE